MRPNPSEIIAELQSVDPSSWLSNPHLRVIDNEALKTLLHKHPDGFKILMESNLAMFRERVLGKDFLEIVLPLRPQFIELVPLDRVSDKLINKIEKAIDSLKDDFEKKELTTILNTIKTQLDDYRTGNKPMDDIKENITEHKPDEANKEQKKDTEGATPEAPSTTSTSDSNAQQSETKPEDDQPINSEDKDSTESTKETDEQKNVEEPQQQQSEDNHQSISDQREVDQLPASEPAITQAKEQGEENNLKETQELPKDEPSTVVTPPSAVTITVTGENALDPKIQKALMEAYKAQLTKATSDSLNDINQKYDEAFKRNTEIQANILSQINVLATNLEAHQTALKLIQDSLNDPTQALLNGFKKEIDETQKSLDDINKALKKHLEDTNKLVNSYTEVLTKPSEEFFNKLAKDVVDKCKTEHSEYAKKAEEELKKVEKVVKETAQNAINAMATEHTNHQKVLADVNGFFDNKKIYQNAAIVAVFANVFLLLIVLVLLAKG